MLTRFLLAMQLQEGRAPATLARYRYALRPFFAFLGERDALAVTPEDVRDYLHGDALSVDRRGLPLTRRNFVRIMERLRAAAKLRTARGSWHDLRHAFVTEMLRSGADAEHLRRMLGHKDQRILARYAHLLTADLVRHHDRHSPATGC